jgi:hypothetical protein
MPFAVAIITNAGSSSEGEYQDSISFPNPAYPPFSSTYVNNGGDNYSSYYSDNRAFVSEERGSNPNFPCSLGGTPSDNCFLLSPSSTLVGSTPMTSLEIEQTHYFNNNTAYVGSSGDGPFTWSLNSWFFSELIENEEAIDKFRFSFFDQAVDYNCGASIFENISWTGSLTFIYDNDTLTFSDFAFQGSNKIEYVYRSVQHGFVQTCHVGLVVEFDLTAFETLELDTFVQDWNWTLIEVELDNFEREDFLPFADTPLPFAGTDEFQLGVEHQPVNSAEAGFLIKTGTIILAVLTFVLAIASTNYWDPFRNAVKGALD